MRLKHAFLLMFCLWTVTVCAQAGADDMPVLKNRKVTLSSGLEGSLLQIAQVKVGPLVLNTIPRYSYFFNTGVDIDFHISKQLVPYTGFQVKNIGIITQISDSLKTKERVYTIGAPVGLKIFNTPKTLMFRLGADIGLGFNYKLKVFVNDNKVSKMNEFFSNRAALLFSSVFAGVYYKGISLSGNYYLTNFYNTSIGLVYGRLFTIGLGIHLDGNAVRALNAGKSEK